eukprot:gene22292-biopygen14759
MIPRWNVTGNINSLRNPRSVSITQGQLRNVAAERSSSSAPFSIHFSCTCHFPIYFSISVSTDGAVGASGWLKDSPGFAPRHTAWGPFVEHFWSVLEPELLWKRLGVSSPWIGTTALAEKVCHGWHTGCQLAKKSIIRCPVANHDGNHILQSPRRSICRVPATTAFPSDGLFMCPRAAMPRDARAANWLKIPVSVPWRIALGIAHSCRPDGLTAAADATGNRFFVGNPGCHPPQPFRAAGCLCVSPNQTKPTSGWTGQPGARLGRLLG